MNLLEALETNVADDRMMADVHITRRHRCRIFNYLTEKQLKILTANILCKLKQGSSLGGGGGGGGWGGGGVGVAGESPYDNLTPRGYVKCGYVSV